MMAASTRQHLNFETCLIQILIELKFHWHVCWNFSLKNPSTPGSFRSVWEWVSGGDWLDQPGYSVCYSICVCIRIHYILRTLDAHYGDWTLDSLDVAAISLLLLTCTYHYNTLRIIHCIVYSWLYTVYIYSTCYNISVSYTHLTLPTKA